MKIDLAEWDDALSL